jgi:signal transduction histidine kinase/ActR/RegA family two-component response regulator
MVTRRRVGTCVSIQSRRGRAGEDALRNFCYAWIVELCSLRDEDLITTRDAGARRLWTASPCRPGSSSSPGRSPTCGHRLPTATEDRLSQRCSLIDTATTEPSSTHRFRREVAARFGVLPNFFCSADAAPGLAEELWKFAKSAYLDSPLPSLFKERLFVHLSRFCEIRYCIVRHVGFLIGQGRPAGDAEALPETVEQVIEMLRRPLPEGAALTTVFARLERMSPDGRLPEPRTQAETDLFDALTILFLSPRAAGRARAAVRTAVGEGTFELLVAYLAFIRTAHYWTEMHPELTYEPDMAAILRGHGELEALLLDTSEAELVQGGVRLRETLTHLRRVEVALQASESRHAFLLRLGDALRPLVDPLAIQEEASRLLGERLGTDRACYAEIDEAQGCILVERNFVRAGVSSGVGRYALSDFKWIVPTFRRGGPVVVADIHTSALIPEPERPALDAVGVGAFVAAPLIKDGRLAAALVVTDLAPRDWTSDEVELVRESAHRTWEASERARAEEQLRQASARKDEFLAMLAHELRNPLAPIRTGLELIRRGGDTVVAVERVRGIMERQIGHMVRLIDDLMDVSRITSGKIVLQREPALLASLVHSAVEANRAAMAAKRIDLRVDLPQAPRVIDVDPTRFVQILSNLLHNAAKFTSDGGSVSLTATVAQPTSHDPPQLAISVVDSGIGISPALLPRVFDLFTQGETRSSQPGLGIGLALARRLVELHAGRLDVRSDGEGQGSEFVVRVPLTTTPSVSASRRRTDEGRLDRRVLIIDDNEDAAHATAMLIEDMGGDARVVYDGESALEILQAYNPEVILLDIGMRGLDGYETCQRIRRVLGNRVLLVALTGFGQEQDKEKATRAGFDAHLTKPADGAALTSVVASRSSSRVVR